MIVHALTSLAASVIEPLAAHQPETHHCHVELARVAALVILRAQREDPVQRQILVARELVNDQLAGEPVDAGGNRGMGGEDRASTTSLQSGVEIIAVLHVLANPLHSEETGVALVGVEHHWRRSARDPAVRADGAYPAHAEQHLLFKPMVGAAAVQPVGHLSLVAGVLLDIGVQHQNGHATHLRYPDLGGEGTSGEWDLDSNRSAFIVQQGQRQRVGIQKGVALLLPARSIQGLPEVPLPIEQADSDDRDTEVACGLEVIAGKNAQAT